MTSLAYARSGTGPPLVLLHGIGSSRQAWDPVVPALAGRFTVIAVDLPGFGDSAPLPAHVEPAPAAPHTTLASAPSLEAWPFTHSKRASFGAAATAALSTPAVAPFAISNNFSKEEADHRLLLMQILIKTADISNPAKPFSIARYWADLVQEEFFMQVCIFFIF